MKKQDIVRYNMLVRVRDFGAAHADLFPAGSLGTTLFGTLGADVAELAGYVTSQTQGRRAAGDTATTKDVARAALYGALEAIARTARALAVGTPGLAARFHLVAIRNDHELVTTARAFARDAAPLASQFVAHGLAAGFLADLSSAIDAFEQAEQARMAARETHVAARVGIATAIDAAFGLLSRLDAVVVNALSGQPALLAAWASARHVERIGGSGAPAEPAKTAGQTPAAVPAASTPSAPAARGPATVAA